MHLNIMSWILVKGLGYFAVKCYLLEDYFQNNGGI